MFNMNSFIKRNLPVFLIGGATLLIFVFLIIAAQSNPPAETELIEVNEDELLAEHTYVKGLREAPVTIVEFSDFECPACKLQHPIAESIIEDYPTLVSWGYRHFPLPQHTDADEAAIAAQAAGEQGKFWEYADILFANQPNFDEDDLISYAQQIGLDVEKFKQDLENRTFREIVDQDVAYGRSLGVNSTPTFFINGKQVVLRSQDDLRRQVEFALRDLNMGEQVDESIRQNIIEENEEVINETLGVKEIAFTEEGFEPRNTTAMEGQLVRWTNTTDEDITFVQLAPRFEELKEPFVIKAGETFEFRLRGKGMWTYKNEGSDTRASIFINAVSSGI